MKTTTMRWRRGRRREALAAASLLLSDASAAPLPAEEEIEEAADGKARRHLREMGEKKREKEGRV